MKRFLLASALMLGLAVPATAQINFQPIPLIVNASTVAACAQAASLSTPIAAGTVVYYCEVLPTSWTGTVAPATTNGLVSPYALSPVTGNTFNIYASVAIPGPTIPAPGFITSTP